MSIIRETQGQCSKCGRPQLFRVYRSINVAENPELKEKVRDGSLFVWECPDCGQVNLAKYESLYHDPASKIMIWLLPSDDIEKSEIEAITRHAKAMGDYTLRRVSDISSLMEKVLVFDSGLDDLTLEMCKYVTRVEMASKAGEDKALEIMKLPMHFYRLVEEGEQKYITLSFPDNGRMVGCNIGFNVYEDCRAILERNPDFKAEEGFSKIDSDWLLTRLQ